MNNQEIKKYYTDREDYDWTEVTDKMLGPEALMHRFREKRIKDCILRYVKPRNTCLDVGCGSSLITRHLPNSSIGLDINPRNIPKLKKHAPHIRGIIGDAENLPFSDNRFDIVVCTEMIEHLLDKDKTVAEIYRVLKPKGLFIGSVPARSFIWKLRFFSFTYHDREPYHHNFTTKELKKLLKGFSILEMAHFFLRSNIYFVVGKLI